jgi:hypothetical protein
VGSSPTLTTNKIIMKIIVESEQLKQEILKQSEYIHDFLINKDDVKSLGKDWMIGLDSDKAGILMHIYMAPEIIEVVKKNI